MISVCIRGQFRTLEWEAVGSAGEVCLQGCKDSGAGEGGREEDTLLTDLLARALVREMGRRG